MKILFEAHCHECGCNGLTVALFYADGNVCLVCEECLIEATNAITAAEAEEEEHNDGD